MRQHRVSLLAVGLSVLVSLAGCVADSTKSASDTPASSPIASAQGEPAPPAAPSSSSEATGGAAGNETGGSAEAAPTLTFTQAVHFVAADGGDLVTEAETYRVQAADSHLSLSAEGRAPLLLDAGATTHSEKIEAPLAVLVPGDDPDVLHVVLLLANGQALDAAGSFSGTRPRAISRLVSAYNLNVAVQGLVVQAPMVTVIDLNGRWTAGSTQSAVISAAGTALTIDMSAYGRPAAKGSIVNGSTITVTFPDDKSYTGILQPPNTIRWSNGSAWAKVAQAAPTTGTTVPNPSAFGPLPGEFAIYTHKKHTYLTARDGGHHSVNAIITSEAVSGDRHGVGPNERFKLARVQPDYTTFQTSRGYYLSIAGSPDVEASSAFQTELRTPDRDPALFRLEGSRSGLFLIKTFNGYFLTALDGGGKATEALHYRPAASSDAQFTVLKCGDLGSGYSYAIRYQASQGFYDRGNYLTAGGGFNNVGQLFATSPSISNSSKFTLIRQGDGSYALQASNRINYVTAVGGGGLAHGDNLHIDATQVHAWEKFRIVDRGDCTYTIQTVSGFYLAFSSGGISTRISDPNAAPSIGYNATWELIMPGL